MVTPNIEDALVTTLEHWADSSSSVSICDNLELSKEKINK